MYCWEISLGLADPVNVIFCLSCLFILGFCVCSVFIIAFFVFVLFCYNLMHVRCFGLVVNICTPPPSVWPHLFCGASSFSFIAYSWSVAVSTMRRQSSRIAAFLQADARPMFCWPTSCSLHCTKPGEARSSWRSLPIWRQPPDHRSDSTVVVLLWWAAGNMSKEPQTSVSDQMGERGEDGIRMYSFTTK